MSGKTIRGQGLLEEECASENKSHRPCEFRLGHALVISLRKLVNPMYLTVLKRCKLGYVGYGVQVQYTCDRGGKR